jgi:hypothetical protein
VDQFPRFLASRLLGDTPLSGAIGAWRQLRESAVGGPGRVLPLLDTARVESFQPQDCPPQLDACAFAEVNPVAQATVCRRTLPQFLGRLRAHTFRVLMHYPPSVAA